MEKIPAAQEFLCTALTQQGKSLTVHEAMIEFAKLHVTAALKAASEKAVLKEIELHLTDGSIDKDSILNSYPPENIK